jgi:hypothetical protein
MASKAGAGHAKPVRAPDSVSRIELLPSDTKRLADAVAALMRSQRPLRNTSPTRWT